MIDYIKPSQTLLLKIKEERNMFDIYPTEENIFRAMDICPLDSVKVVILGQDPYHGVNQANGLAFSVDQGNKIPPSLRNILKEYNDDLQTNRNNPDLADWACKGVLLLNSVLTVRSGKPESHSKIGWQQYTDAIIKQISDEKIGIVFLLWGNYAKSKMKLIDLTKHKILTANHPSPLSANRGNWFGCKHFSKTNDILGQNIFY